MSIITNGSRMTLQNEFGKLGERLIRFGQALQNPETTIEQLTGLARSCGINLRLRTTAESGERSDE